MVPNKSLQVTFDPALIVVLWQERSSPQTHLSFSYAL